MMEVEDQETEHNSGDIESSEDITNDVNEDDNSEEAGESEGDGKSLPNSKLKEKPPIRIGNVIKKELKSVRHEFKIKKVHMCSRLKRKADKLRKKKSPPEIKAKNEAHADALIEELRASNHISVSKAAEFYMKHTKRDLLVILMNSRTTEPVQRFLAKTGTVFETVISRVVDFQSKYPNWKDILRIYFAKSSIKRTELLADYANLGPDTVLEECEDEKNIENKTEEEKTKDKKNQKCRKGKNKRVKLKNKENKTKSDQVSEDEMNTDDENRNVKLSGDESNFDDSDDDFVSSNDLEIPADESGDSEAYISINEPSQSTAQNSLNTTKTKPKMSIDIPLSESETSDNESRESDCDDTHKMLDDPILLPKTSVCLPAEKYMNKTKRKISESEPESEDEADLEPTLIDTSEQLDLNNSNQRLNRSERRRLAKLNDGGIGSLKKSKKLKLPEIPEPVELKPDPFFMTKDDKDYLSRSSVKIPESLGDEVKNKFNYKSKIPKPSASFMDRPKFKPRQNDDFSLENFNPKFKPNFNKESKFTSKIPPKTNFGIKPTSAGFKNIGEKPHTLHPSWEAKKKKSGITEFKGSKIVFD